MDLPLFLSGALSHSVSKTKIKNLRLTDVAKVIEAGKIHNNGNGKKRSASAEALEFISNER